MLKPSKRVMQKIRAMSDEELIRSLVAFAGNASCMESEREVGILGKYAYLATGARGIWSRKTEIEYVQVAFKHYLLTVEYARRSKRSRKETGHGLGGFDERV